jgi:hypothetical protein
MDAVPELQHYSVPSGGRLRGMNLKKEEMVGPGECRCGPAGLKCQIMAVYVEKDLTKAAYYHWRLMRAIDLKALSKDLRSDTAGRPRLLRFPRLWLFLLRLT